MFTSGSTGEPKGVVITLRCLLTFLTWLLETQTFAAGEVFLNQVPYSFDVSIMDTYGALLTGGTIFSLTRDDVGNPKRMYQLLAASNLTTWVSTPSFAQLCLAERTFNATMLPHLRRFLFCGEALPPNVAAQLLDRFPSAEVWNTYGPTETTVATTAVQVDRALLDRYPQLPIGTALPNTEVLVVGPDRTPLPEGERGEIVIVGPNVSPGYIGRPDLTERSFFEVGGQPAYATGDWGRSQHGLLFTDGRIDSQIKLHGHRIELGDVEANLCALPGVSDAVVVPVVRNGQAESLSAFVILAERPAGTDFELSRSLQRRLGERVPDYMVPRKFHFLEALPMNANGKADRRQLIEPVS
jgi:D-alanine--poly(phosphoribitol) ligase subunit 1